MRVEPLERHDLRPEDLLRSDEAEPRRVHGLAHQRHARVAHELQPPGPERDVDERSDRQGPDRCGQGLRQSLPAGVATQPEGPRRARMIVDRTQGIAGAYCTKLLADLGYDVVKATPVEPGALHAFLARNKRLDASVDIATADAVIANERVDAPTLVTITPFGLDTPWSDKPATE